MMTGKCCYCFLVGGNPTSNLTSSRVSCPRVPANFFPENSGGKAHPQNFKNLGGNMARPHTRNLALPFFDLAPPSTPITIIAKIVETMGGFPNPPTMELSISAMLEHHKLPG